jgi:hypothetical protein
MSSATGNTAVPPLPARNSPRRSNNLPRILPCIAATGTRAGGAVSSATARCPVNIDRASSSGRPGNATAGRSARKYPSSSADDRSARIATRAPGRVEKRSVFTTRRW